jgi:hypothetical protein
MKRACAKCFIFFCALILPALAFADISFINGVWTGTGTGKQGTFCLKATLKATSASGFVGSLDEFDSCAAVITDGCTLQGQVSVTDITFSASNCLHPKTNSCITSGQLNASFSSMNLIANCPAFYLVNFGQPNRLYRNNGNQTFTDVTQSAGVGFNGKSVAVATRGLRQRSGYGPVRCG